MFITKIVVKVQLKNCKLLMKVNTVKNKTKYKK